MSRQNHLPALRGGVGSRRGGDGVRCNHLPALRGARLKKETSRERGDSAPTRQRSMPGEAVPSRL
jgi:hypothetical protein